MSALLNIPINWVDFLFLLVLAIGVARGRSRGMSEEVLDLVKWVLILVTAGHLYEPIGIFMARHTALSTLTCYITVYALILLTYHGIFAYIRNMIGQKLLTSDAFGDGEYYMGMVAGAFRFFCIIVVVLAFLNARLYTPEEIRADEAYQENNFGSIRLPTFNRLQSAVFQGSGSGRLAKNYLATYLIRPTSPEDKPLGGGKTIYGRDQNLKEVLENK